MWLKLFLKLLNFLKDSVLFFCQFLIFQASGILLSLRKQPADGDATSGFLARLRNERRNSILMTCHYPNLLGHAAWKFDSTSQKHYPDLGSDASLVWNICAPFLRRHLAGKHVIARRQMSAVFSGYFPLSIKLVFNSMGTLYSYYYCFFSVADLPLHRLPENLGFLESLRIRRWSK